ncbi:M42 family metallopeptidase [Neofamilia massiliensis]|uniref:M42 family metallopeptidase n=1 Tax=Neofamilia massiliensis TaxID=1673724 RepID=UPI0006BB58C9|nr:M42 family metallopeptidase [Neofamilia massiliensis]
MKIDLDYIIKTFEDLVKIPSPSGYTEEAMAYVKNEFENLGVKFFTTNKGAVYGVIDGEDNDQSILLTSHVDTLGAMVLDIKDNGRLKLASVGGFAWGSIEGENALVHTDSGKVYSGSLLPEKASVHIFAEASEERKEENMEIRLDNDVRSAKETRGLGIEVGDFVSFDPRFMLTENGYVKSRHIDDKICVAIQLGLCKALIEAKEKPKYQTYFYIANYEEIGHGLYHIPENCTEVIAVDIGTVGGTNTSSEKAVTIFAKDSSTPYDYGIKKTMVELCKTKDIPYRVDIARRYGSDASAALRQGKDVRTACIGPGVDSTHHYERTHKDGILASANLVMAYLLRK